MSRNTVLDKVNASEIRLSPEHALELAILAAAARAWSLRALLPTDLAVPGLAQMIEGAERVLEVLGWTEKCSEAQP